MNGTDLPPHLARLSPDELDAVNVFIAEADRINPEVVGKFIAQHRAAAARSPERVAAREAERVAEQMATRRFIDWSEFWSGDEPETEWLIPNVIQIGQQGCVYARPGVGKSLYVLEQAALLVTGRGHLPEPTDVLYIDLENSQADIRQRLAAMGYGPGDDLSRLHYSLLGDWPPLNTPEGGRAVHEAVTAYNARLVIVDTTSRVITGDSWHGDTITAMWTHTQVALKREGVAFIRLDHSNKSDGLIGSIMKSADLDVLWRMERAGTDGDSVVMECEKDRSGAVPVGTRLAFTRTSEPLRHVLPSAFTDQKAWALVDRENEILDALDAAGVPRSAGRDAVKKALTSLGVKPMSDLDMARIVRFRKTGGIGVENA